jgi:hypothetical protein
MVLLQADMVYVLWIVHRPDNTYSKIGTQPTEQLCEVFVL